MPLGKVWTPLTPTPSSGLNNTTIKKSESRWYPVETLTDRDYADDLAHLTNTPALAESL